MQRRRSRLLLQEESESGGAQAPPHASEPPADGKGEHHSQLVLVRSAADVSGLHARTNCLSPPLSCSAARCCGCSSQGAGRWNKHGLGRRPPQQCRRRRQRRLSTAAATAPQRFARCCCVLCSPRSSSGKPHQLCWRQPSGQPAGLWRRGGLATGSTHDSGSAVCCATACRAPAAAGRGRRQECSRQAARCHGCPACRLSV